MGPEMLSTVGIIFAALNCAIASPTSNQVHFDKQCKSICAEAKGNSKFDANSLTCFCDITKITTDVVINLMTKKAQENGVDLKIIRSNPNAKRETFTDLKKMPSESDFENVLGQDSPNTVPERQRQKPKELAPIQSIEVSSKRPPNIINERTSPSTKDATESETVLGQAAPNILPERQRQKPKVPTPSQPSDLSKKRPPNIINQKTSPVSKDASESETVLGQDAPNIVPERQRQKTNGPAPVESINNEKTSPLSKKDPKESKSGPAFPNTGSSRQRQKTKGSAPVEPMEVSSNNQKTSPVSKDASESETVLGQDAPNIVPERQRQKTKGPSVNDENTSPISKDPKESKSGPASPNTGPSRQRQKTKGSAPVEPMEVGSNNQKTSPASKDASESETVLGQDAPNIVPERQRQKTKEPAPEDKGPDGLETASGRAFRNTGPPLVSEGEPISSSSSSKQTARRSTPTQRKSPALKRPTYNNEPFKRALESARQHIDTLIQRANQPSFNPSTVGAEIEAICATLRSVAHRVNESARNSERSALMEQIRERERERHARIHSRFGGHEERQRKLKPHLVGAANPPKDNDADDGKTGESRGTKDERKENAQKAAPGIITQPPELVVDD